MGTLLIGEMRNGNTTKPDNSLFFIHVGTEVVGYRQQQVSSSISQFTML
jgi:hypothetical protein